MNALNLNKKAVLWCCGLLLLLALVLPGCGTAGSEDLAVTAAPVEKSSAPEEVLAARVAVLRFLRDGAGECVPPKGVTWTEVPGNAPAGFDVYRFDSEGCLMTVSFPLPAAESTNYHVTLHNRVTGFCWQANVDAEGTITATGMQAGMLPELVNAAAAYCKEQGHTYDVQEQKDGQQCGVCLFEEGESCNAWAYLQGICSP